jgi:ABC-type uncharacterized transport system auxiliary subunit
MAWNCRGLLLPVVVAMLACGCAAPYYFDLQGEVPEGTAGVKIDKVLLIDPVAISETYRDYRIVIRESPFRVEYAGSASWSRTPDELIEEAVIRFWGRRSVFRKIGTHEDVDDHDLTMKIRVEAIEKCRVGKRWHARLALDMEIVDSQSDATLLRHSFDRREPLAGRKTRLMPEKVSRILHEELMRIESRLRQGGAG